MFYICPISFNNITTKTRDYILLFLNNFRKKIFFFSDTTVSNKIFKFLNYTFKFNKKCFLLMNEKCVSNTNWDKWLNFA